MADDKRTEQAGAAAQAPAQAPPRNPVQRQPPAPDQQRQPSPGLQATPQATVEYSDEQKAAKPESFQFIDTLLVEITAGPWRGMIAHLPNADAEQALADKWAVKYEQRSPDPHAELPPPLTAEELETANAAAQAYADSLTAPPEDQGGEGEGGAARSGERSPAQQRRDEEQRRARDLQAGQRGPGYETRSKE